MQDMNEDKEIQRVIQRSQDLTNRRKEILSLPPEKALNAILDSPQPLPLVHSFPEQDLYYLIHDIGIADALPILSLASDSQWEYILDMEIWERDRIHAGMVSRWLDLLFRVDPNRFVRWFLHQQTDFIEHYLFKHVEVKIREYDQNPSEFGEDFFTLDEMFYVRVIGYPFDAEPDPETKKIIEEFLPKFLDRLAAYDHTKYQHALMESRTIIPAEYEEEAYRLRNVRLAEKGFLPFEDAVGIYQPLSPEDIQNRPVKYSRQDVGIRPLVPVPIFPAELFDADNLFAIALKKIDREDLLEQIQAEFAGLANQIIVADRKKVKQRKALREVVKKACGYLAIGLERLSGEDGKPDPDRSAALIRDIPLSQIFKVGYGLALDLKRRAEKWRRKSWFERRNLPLGFWDEEWLGVLGGLLIKRPLFYDGRKTGVIYREFHSMADVKTTETALNQIIAFDSLLSLMAPQFETVPDVMLTYKNLMLTLWARHCLKLPEPVLPIPLEAFRRFYDTLWSGTDMPRKISRAMKESFLLWVSEQTALQQDEIIRSLGRALENLFAEIESECGEVSGKDLDPRYIFLFLLKNQ